MPRKPSSTPKRQLSAAPDSSLFIFAIPDLPEIQKGDRVADLIVAAARRANLEFQDSDIFVVAQKIISKSEGRVLLLSEVRVSRRAATLGEQLSRDPRFVEVVLNESRRILRAERVLIVETHHGFVCANAGVDHSNVPGHDSVALLPKNPDRSARRLAAALRRKTGKRVAVIVSDTFGRPWRLGLTNVAIGAAGVPVLLDLRGRRDSHGRLLRATVLAVADELASAAGLLMGKSAGNPVVIIRGFRYRPAQVAAARIVRPAREDLFR